MDIYLGVLVGIDVDIYLGVLVGSDVDIYLGVLWELYRRWGSSYSINFLHVYKTII